MRPRRFDVLHMLIVHMLPMVRLYYAHETKYAHTMHRSPSSDWKPSVLAARCDVRTIMHIMCVCFRFCYRAPVAMRRTPSQPISQLSKYLTVIDKKMHTRTHVLLQVLLHVSTHTYQSSWTAKHEQRDRNAVNVKWNRLVCVWNMY